MPRLSPATIRRACSIDRLLPQLLPVCRDLRSAQNELRWLRQHAAEVSKVHCIETILTRLVARRADGEPLQYILGSEYFGDLEIKCNPGVLIPRQETATAVQYLVQRLLHVASELRVLDLCTGTGCIPLLFDHDFNSNAANQGSRLSTCGVDISEQAIILAEENLSIQQAFQTSTRIPHCHSRSIKDRVSFLRADIFDKQTFGEKLESQSVSKVDVLISNPPYISDKGYHTTAARSVRMFEPKLALVPESRLHIHDCPDGDTFYPRLLDIARDVEASVLLFEVADMDQAERVASLIASHNTWDGLEIWRDDPRAAEKSHKSVYGHALVTRGVGNGRSVVAYRSGHSRPTLKP